MLSNVSEDDDRFLSIINDGISKGTVESYPAYENETPYTRQIAKDQEKQRREAFDKRQATERAAASANDKTNGTSKKTAKKTAQKRGIDDMAGLAALIQQRQKSRAGGFFDSLEAKYAPKSRGSKRSTPMDEPPEELFEAIASRAKKAKKDRGESDDQDLELGEEDIGESEEEGAAPRNSRTRSKAKRRGRAKAKA